MKFARTEIGRNAEDKFQEPFGMKVALVTRVDEINLKVDLKILTGGGEASEVDISQALCGPRSFWGGIPERGALCIIAYRKKSKQIAQPVILGFLPIGARAGLRFDPISPIDPGEIDEEDADSVDDFFGPTIRYRRLKLRPGDVGGLSSSGAEFVMSRDVRLTNRAGDAVELRDSDRTLITQAIHRVDSVSGVFALAGPIRRGAMFLPTDIAVDGTLREGYLGKDVLTNTGPGLKGGTYKFAGPDGKLLSFFQNEEEFPPVMYTNGRRVFYPATNVATNFEDPDQSFGALAYTEHRLEISHTTDATQEIREEIDGFQIDRNRIFIEQVFGTLVGNDTSATDGMRQYGRLLKPVVFDDLFQGGPGKFRLEAIPRAPHETDVERDTTTGAYLFRIKPPARKDKDTEYGFSVSKQGKVFFNIPGSTVERYPTGAKNVSVEGNIEGAIKLFVGAETSRNASLIINAVGGITGRIGHLDNGKAIDVKFGSSIDMECTGTNDEDNMAYRATINGNESKVVTGDSVQNTQGAISHTANGGYSVRADAINHSATNGLNANYGGISIMSTAKSQYNYSQMVLENIVTQGRTTTIMAGALTDTILVGARTYTTTAGAVSWISPAGAYSITVGAGVYSVTVGGGAIQMTAGAAVSMTAGAVMALTAAAAMNLTAGAAISLVSPQVLVGGPSAVLGVARGLPMMPPGVPSLCWITALPAMGSATFRSIL